MSIVNAQILYRFSTQFQLVILNEKASPFFTYKSSSFIGSISLIQFWFSTPDHADEDVDELHANYVIK
jgi:hypothetical protein